MPHLRGQAGPVMNLRLIRDYGGSAYCEHSGPADSMCSDGKRWHVIVGGQLAGGVCERHAREHGWYGSRALWSTSQNVETFGVLRVDMLNGVRKSGTHKDSEADMEGVDKG